MSKKEKKTEEITRDKAETKADGTSRKEEEKQKIHVLTLIRQFAGYAWRCSPSYFIFYVLDLLVYAFAPFVNIIFPAYIIDELIGQQRVKKIEIVWGK